MGVAVRQCSEGLSPAVASMCASKSRCWKPAPQQLGDRDPALTKGLTSSWRSGFVDFHRLALF